MNHLSVLVLLLLCQACFAESDPIADIETLSPRRSFKIVEHNDGDYWITSFRSLKKRRFGL